jgi:N-acetyl-gamma-glutamyl-phosphate reductase
MPFAGENSLEDNYLHPMGCNETNRLDLFVFGNDTQAVLASRLDNLGKGASGAAVQCMNIRLGVDEKTGLTW